MFYTHVFPRKVVVLLTSKNDQRKHARHPYRPKDDDDAFRAAKGGSICRLPPKSPPVFFVRERKYLFSSHFFPKRDDDCTLVRHFFSLILLHPSFVRLGRKREKRHRYHSIPMSATTMTTSVVTSSSSSRGVVGTLGRRARRHASAGTPKGVNWAVRSNASSSSSSLGRSACSERGRCAPREEGRRRDAHHSTASFSGRREEKIIVALKVVVHKRAHRKINGGWAMRSSIGDYDDDDDDEKKTTERDGDGKTAANETTAENRNHSNKQLPVDGLR